jgi:hypothetical protein
VIEEVPEESGFSEEVATLILGSRRPVLFVEGGGTSLDRAVYRACYPKWTVIPRGSCEEVIHAVATMRANAVLTRVTCAGIVDADAYDASDIQKLQAWGVEVLPVSEIENLFLLPVITQAILEAEGFAGQELAQRRDAIANALFAFASNPTNQANVVIGYARRRIDRILKKLDLSAAPTISALGVEYATQTAALDIAAIAKFATDRVQEAIGKRDAKELLRWFDNKGLMSIAAQAKGQKVDAFEQWILRAVRNGTAPELSNAITSVLPTIKPA